MESQRKNEKWDTIIRPRKGWFDIDFKELIRYRDLIILMVKRNFTVMYKQTILGPAWVIIQPLMTTLIFTVVFGNIAGLPTDGLPKFLFYMAGNITWQFFASCLTNTSQTFTSNRQLFGKVYFPRLCMPFSTVLTQLINFGVQFLIFLAFVVFYAVQPNSAVQPNGRLILFTPLLLLQLGILGLGFGIIISALTTKYRDLQMLVSFGVQLWMYATPVAYASSMIPEQYYFVYMLNPMSPIIELFRSAYLGVNSFDPVTYCISVMTTLVVLVVGILLFNKIEKNFIDTV
ncbi:ABC transporter permease [Anaerotruncus massiliensis (ex Liu et al. 2021)]|uniref:ABC transporter permease n=1 Tax=Anaerotruncus massiliensis (ex Liu et al. 2021) TaxID=2321404 RepID=UPI003A8C1EA1